MQGSWDVRAARSRIGALARDPRIPRPNSICPDPWKRPRLTWGEVDLSPSNADGSCTHAPESRLIAAPTAEDQLRFLRDVQRLLEEGSFTATYKFALVHAIADLAVQRGDDSGEELPLPIAAIAERFVELYWRQVLPWQGPDRSAVLQQNTGRQAAIVRRVREARDEWGGRLDRFRADPNEWRSLTREVGRVVRVMPLWKLQRVGKEVRDFLYEQGRIEGTGADASIVLKPGIAYCLRAFHPLVLELARGAWVKFVRRLNTGTLSEQTELEEFLFGASRSVLSAVRGPLLELQNGDCFYCGGAIPRDAHVDHFVPWSRYPVDLGHNFVVVHSRCNLAKSDHLAAMPHLERWVQRNREHRYDLDLILEDAGLPSDGGVSLRVTRWAYGQVADRKGLVWHRGKAFIRLDPRWRSLLAAG